MDTRIKPTNKLHCHFFHTSGKCKKGVDCQFLHGTKLKGCPNGDKCPIDILHFNMEDDKEPTPKKGVKETTPKKNEQNKGYNNEHQDSEEEKIDVKKESKTKFEIPKELEAEEMKETHVKLPPKPVVIKEDLPIEIKALIQDNYNENQEAANFISNFYLLRGDMNSFLPIYQRMFPRMELDLMFIVDCTGSMGHWIQAVKNEISNIIATIKDQNKGNISIRLSFSGYRDYGDTDRFSIFEFSDDLDGFQTFLNQVQAQGGNDAPEDVAGGFKNANLQNWKSQAKYAVLLADYPAHGIIYCNQSGDRYPQGDPDGVDLKDEFKKLLKKGVKVYAVEITPHTKQMFDLFKQYNKEECGQDLDIPKLGHSTQGFSQYISQTASQTLSMSYTKSTKEDPQGAFYKALKICQGQNTVQNTSFLQRFNFKDAHESDESEKKDAKDIKEVSYKISPAKEFPHNIFSQNFEAICHSYFIVQDVGVPINWRKPLVQNSQIKTKIQISRVPFAEGAMRYAFFAKDTLLNQKLVAKLNKKQRITNPELDKEDMIKDLESQFICQHIVNQFNDRVSVHVQATENLKSFVHCFIYEFTDTAHPYKFYSAENYIPGEYVKFNNNAGWCNFKFDEPGLLSQALSHFSYQITEGYLMIVDLQGVGGLLTDPQIHCLDQHRFGSGNLGYEGMFKFFMSHQCNQFCKQLNLIHPQIKEIPKDLKFFNQELEKPINPHQKVCTMCDVCRKPFKTTAGFLYERRSQCREKYCPPCNSMRIATLKTEQCSQCVESFSYSVYWTLMKRTQASDLCIKCRKLDRDRMREKLEKE